MIKLAQVLYIMALDNGNSYSLVRHRKAEVCFIEGRLH